MPQDMKHILRSTQKYKGQHKVQLADRVGDSIVADSECTVSWRGCTRQHVAQRPSGHLRVDICTECFHNTLHSRQCLQNLVLCAEKYPHQTCIGRLKISVHYMWWLTIFWCMAWSGSEAVNGHPYAALHGTLPKRTCIAIAKTLSKRPSKCTAIRGTFKAGASGGNVQPCTFYGCMDVFLQSWSVHQQFRYQLSWTLMQVRVCPLFTLAHRIQHVCNQHKSGRRRQLLRNGPAS